MFINQYILSFNQYLLICDLSIYKLIHFNIFLRLKVKLFYKLTEGKTKKIFQNFILYYKLIYNKINIYNKTHIIRILIID